MNPRSSRDWHRWLGLTLGFAFVLLGLSGAVAAFREEIGTAANPEQRSASSAPLASLELERWIATARSGVGAEAPLLSVRIPPPGRTVEVTLDLRSVGEGERGGRPAPTIAFVDPATGEFRGKQVFRDTLLGKVFVFHHDLFLGRSGHTLQFFIAALILILLVAGVWLALPRLFNPARPDWKKASWTTRFAYLHRLIGVYALALLMLPVATGLYLARSDWFPFRDAPESPRSESVRGDSGKTMLNYAVLSQAIGAHGLPLHDLLIRQDRRTGKVTLTSGHAGDTRRFRFDGEQGALDEIVPSRGQAIHFFIHRLHEGEYLGVLGRALGLIAGLLPLFFYVSGWMVWRRMRRASARATEPTYDPTQVPQASV